MEMKKATWAILLLAGFSGCASIGPSSFEFLALPKDLRISSPLFLIAKTGTGLTIRTSVPSGFFPMSLFLFKFLETETKQGVPLITLPAG
jgi:hypothetical protein